MGNLEVRKYFVGDNECDLSKPTTDQWTQQSSSDKLTFAELLKKLLASYGTWRFTCMFSSSPSMNTILSEKNQFIPYNFVYLRTIFMLSSHLCLPCPSRFSA